MSVVRLSLHIVIAAMWIINGTTVLNLKRKNQGNQGKQQAKAKQPAKRNKPTNHYYDSDVVEVWEDDGDDEGYKNDTADRRLKKSRVERQSNKNDATPPIPRKMVKVDRNNVKFHKVKNAGRVLSIMDAHPNGRRIVKVN
jgi:hypothetical protein